jgi:hypothetical protein
MSNRPPSEKAIAKAKVISAQLATGVVLYYEGRKVTSVLACEATVAPCVALYFEGGSDDDEPVKVPVKLVKFEEERAP